MYTITFPIHVFRSNEDEYVMPAGLARDVSAQLKLGEKVKIIVPQASAEEQISSPFKVNTKQYPDLKIVSLPYIGRRSYCTNIFRIVAILKSAAEQSSTWHTGCSTNLFDITALSFLVGRKFARKLRVLCLDSDPASMLEQSGFLQSLKTRIVRARYRSWAGEVDAVIFVGSGVEVNYSKYARRFVTTAAVWLNDGDLATESETIKKYLPSDRPVRFCLPSRLTQWKGVDDTIAAFKAASTRLPKWELDIMGDGPELEKLRSQADGLVNINFVSPLDYGKSFFEKLRTYDVVIIPTRGLEEARIAYDAAASGCVIICSNTRTLRQALRDVRMKWEFEPGNPESLLLALVRACQSRDSWTSAGLEGIGAMKGRTIQEMHQRRFEFFESLKRDRR